MLLELYTVPAPRTSECALRHIARRAREWRQCSAHGEMRGSVGSHSGCVTRKELEFIERLPRLIHFIAFQPSTTSAS